MFAADTAGLLAALDLPPAHVVGLSLGGCVAFQFAIDYPARVKTLTIVNSGPAMFGTPEQAQKEIDRRVGIVQQLGMRAMGQALGPVLLPKPEHASLRERFVERWAQNDPQAYIEATRSMLGWDVTGRLARSAARRSSSPPTRTIRRWPLKRPTSSSCPMPSWP
jgi:pimeloyl-ACP methyl ester carboxylesterase